MWNRLYKDLKKYGIGIGAVILLYFTMHFFLNGFCFSVVVTGFPCPGCGLTRSILFLLQGQFMRSWLIHPLGIGIVCFFIYAVILRYFLGKPIYGWKKILIVFVLTAILLYAVRMIQFFPNRPPYSYTKGNILEKLIPHYKEYVSYFLKSIG